MPKVVYVAETHTYALTVMYFHDLAMQAPIHREPAGSRCLCHKARISPTRGAEHRPDHPTFWRATEPASRDGYPLPANRLSDHIGRHAAERRCSTRPSRRHDWALGRPPQGNSSEGPHRGSRRFTRPRFLLGSVRRDRL
jgi:hypothetical protein